jgi:hypothetical protein
MQFRQFNARLDGRNTDIVLGMVGGKCTSLRELRDRAILLLGFYGAFRRSELVALNLGDIEWITRGLFSSTAIAEERSGAETCLNKSCSRSQKCP